MSFLQKMWLFQRLLSLPVKLTLILFVLVVGRRIAESGLMDSSPSGLRMTGLLINLLFPAILVAVVFSYFKYRRGLRALAQGDRLQATVTGVRLHQTPEDAEPLYVLDWIDADGNSGSSLPGELYEFVGYKEGVSITIYRNNQHDSWWERDILDA